MAAIALLAGTAAACSADSGRLAAGGPFDNPFGMRQPEPSHTGSIQSHPTPSVQSAPLSPVSSQPLPPVASQPLPPPTYGQSPSPMMASPAPAPMAPRTAEYSPPRAAPAARPAGKPGWTATGGTAVTVGAGESIHTLSQRYGVPASEILAANGLPSASAVRPGMRVIIPVYSIGAAETPQVRGPQLAMATPGPLPPRKAPEPPQPAAGGGKVGVHVAAPGETLSSVARLYGTGRNTLAAANRMEPDTQLKVGQRLLVPGAAVARAPQPPKPAPTLVAAAPQPVLQAPRVAVKAPEPKPTVVAAAAPVAAAPAAPATDLAAFAPAPQPAVAAQEKPPVKTVAKVDPAPAAPAAPEVAFRWPVRGRVISGFGTKPSGGSNDGINLAVPEGTAVKAADDGVVAYVGNELKGFGNLVLVRHADGWVTAYAHNSELTVKRGETVRRGQVIAKSGKTGNVETPQLHFEIRRGSSPVDPMKHLPDA